MDLSLIESIEVKSSGITLFKGAKTQSLTITESQDSYIALSSGITDSAVNFGGVADAKALMIIPTEIISIKINGSSDKIYVDEGGMALHSSGLTSLSMSNESGLSTTVRVVLCE